MAKPIDIEDKPDLAKIAEEASHSVDYTVLRKGGKDIAVVLSTDAYQSLIRKWETDFSVFDRIDEAMQGADPVELEQDIARAVEEVKALKRRRNSDA
jgi:hypothetical protein